MTQARSLQAWVHWLEVGEGARWIRRGALFLALALLSVRIAFVQFHGPLTEKTLAQIVVGRQLADGKGFTTLINYPQTAAWLRLRGQRFDVPEAFPELHEPPLYSALVGAVLKLLPTKTREHLFATAPVPPDGWGPDYVLLVLDVVLLWLAAWLTFSLGRKLFESAAGLIASFALMLSVSVWDQTVAVNGMPLMMVLLLGLFHALAHVEEREAEEKTPWSALLGCGVLSGLLFLGDYPTGLLVILLLAYGWLRFFGRTRWLAVLLIVAGFLLVTSPWILRNVRLTGNTLGLAGQAVALKAGDSTAEPATIRATLSTAAPVLDLNKLGNKGLTSLQNTLRDRMWAGGGFFLTAFFVVGFLYRFRNRHVNRLRWMAVMILALLVASQAFLDSGEGERLPIVYATPVLMVFGAGFFLVLVASSDSLARHTRWVTAGLLFAQALPLIHDIAEPRGIHFNYPPYYPALFLTLRSEVRRVGGDGAIWMADVPAGAAWYSGQRVWAQPATLRDFYAINVEQPLRALVLTPHILDRPFFSDLARTRIGGDRFGEWGQVYTGLVTGRLPPAFPLSLPQRMAENFYVLIDPLMLPNAGK